MKSVPVEEAIALVGDDKVKIIDVRTVEEFAGGHIKGAVHVPYEDLLDSAAAEAKAQEVLNTVQTTGANLLLVHCMYSKARGPLVAQSLSQKAQAYGVEVAILEGGFHNFVNKVHGPGDEMPPEGANLVEGFQPDRWRRTAACGLVDVEGTCGLRWR